MPGQKEQTQSADVLIFHCLGMKQVGTNTSPLLTSCRPASDPDRKKVMEDGENEEKGRQKARAALGTFHSVFQWIQWDICHRRAHRRRPDGRLKRICAKIKRGQTQLAQRCNRKANMLKCFDWEKTLYNNILVAGTDSGTGAGLTGLTPHRVSIETTQTVLTSVSSRVMKTLL